MTLCYYPFIERGETVTKTSYVLEKIRDVMDRKHFTMSDLAGVLGWQQSKLSKIFSGQQKLTTEDLVDIAFALGVNPGTFFKADSADKREASDEILLINKILTKISEKRSDADALIQYLEVEFPKTINCLLHVDNDGRKVEAFYRYKRIIKTSKGSPRLFTPNPHILISDKGEEATLGNRLTLGYWFTKDLSSVYLTIHYANQTFSTAGQRQRMNDETDMRFFFESVVNMMNIDLNDIKKDSNAFDVRSAFKKGVILCKGYSLDDVPTEKILQEDLLTMYEIYCDLLNTASARMIDTYQYLWSENIKEINISSEDLIAASKPMEIDEILPVSQPHKKRIKVNRDNVALIRENYCCEIDLSHSSFISRKTGKPYMMTHYLIPISKQIALAKDVDIREISDNIVCLCPMCHALLENGENELREEMLMKLYMKHKDALKKAGVDISMMQLLKMYDIN